jgi:hypoxanthine phosphoribosyltransferase
MKSLKPESLKPIIVQADIHRKVGELAARISADYRGKELVLVCNLKGAFIFLADLCRSIDIPVAIDFIAVTSYKGTHSTGNVRIVKDLKMNIADRHVLLVEDIVDTGYTLQYIMSYIGLHKPLSVRVCTLLDKKCMRKVDVPIDYVGFEIGDRFVVGYGLDYNEMYREIEFIAELQLEGERSEQQ